MHDERNANPKDPNAPDSDATSKETLSDLAENEANLGSNTSEPSPGPSPDGTLDESDAIKDAGPV